MSDATNRLEDVTFNVVLNLKLSTANTKSCLAISDTRPKSRHTRLSTVRRESKTYN